MMQTDVLLLSTACALAAQTVAVGVLIALHLSARRGREAEGEEAGFWFRQCDQMLGQRRRDSRRIAALEDALSGLLGAAEAYAAVAEDEVDAEGAAGLHADLADAIDEAEDVLG